MKNKIIDLGLALLLLSAMLLTSCATSTTSKSVSTSTTTAKPVTTTNTTITTTVTTSGNISTTTTATKVTGSWWDNLGAPQYGGKMVISSSYDFPDFDPYYSSSNAAMQSAWMERMYGDNWALDPKVFDFTIAFRPPEYVQGLLAKSWEFTGPSTYIVTLNQGIHWQNIPPANGRELVASDIVYHYSREYGLGNGFSKGSPFLSSSPIAQNLISVTATDNYTVVFQWKTANQEYILESIQAIGPENCIENPEAVQQWGNLEDWHHAIGTGPFILTDYVTSGSATMVRNPSYWGFDERHPQNKLPYVDALQILIIPNQSTVLAAMRTGKVDVVENVSRQDAQSMQKTNPEILQLSIPMSQAYTVDPRIDKAPFTDIKVREALQKAINLPDIAANYYGGTAPPYPLSLTSYYEKGWGLPYDQWPQDVKDQYAFDPPAAKALLTAAGFPTGFHTDCVADTAADTALLQVVQSAFNDIGVVMDIRMMDSASWTAYVRTNHSQDALAYRSSGSLGMAYEPTRQFNRYKTGYVANYEMVSDPFIDDTAVKAAAATSVDTVKQLLKDENLYIAQQHFVVSLLIPSLFGLYQPWLKGYAGQAYGLSGASSGPMMLGYYASRFWIDQNMK